MEGIEGISIIIVSKNIQKIQTMGSIFLKNKVKTFKKYLPSLSKIRGEKHLKEMLVIYVYFEICVQIPLLSIMQKLFRTFLAEFCSEQWIQATHLTLE
jgi:hypothetical protein